MQPVLSLKNMSELGIFNNIIQQKKSALLLFTSEGCHWCKKLWPEWNKFKSLLYDKHVTLIEINAKMAASIGKILNIQIKGFPSIIAVANGQVIGEYRGNRTSANLMLFYKSKFNSREILV